MDIAAGISAVTNAISITKSLKELEKSYDAVVLKGRIIELMEALLEAKGALADAKAVLDCKDRELAQVRQAFQDRGALSVGDDDYKFKTDQNGNKVGYPICPKCEAVSGKIVQLKPDKLYHSAKCPACDSQFSPVTCYLPANEIQGNIDTVAKRRAENQRQAMERLASYNRDQSPWI